MLNFLQANMAWIVYWILTVIGLIGVVLNIKQDRRCFLLWTVTNAGFAVQTFFFRTYNLTFLFLIYLGFSLIGLHQWRD